MSSDWQQLRRKLKAEVDLPRDVNYKLYKQQRKPVKHQNSYPRLKSSGSANIRRMIMKLVWLLLRKVERVEVDLVRIRVK